MGRRGLYWRATLIIILALPLTNAFAQIYDVTDMNTEQLRAIDRAKSVVLLPGGILEGHGPYLPSYSDGYYNERITQELASAIVARPGWSVLIFPMVPLGASGANEIGGKYSFSGTYAVLSSTVRSASWTSQRNWASRAFDGCSSFTDTARPSITAPSTRQATTSTTSSEARWFICWD